MVPPIEQGLKGARETMTGRFELGDVIVSVAGKPVATVDELMDVMEAHKVGDQVRWRFCGGTHSERVSVTLQAVN